MMRRGARIALAIVLATASAWSGAPKRAVRLLEPTCDARPVDLTQYRALLRVELEAAGFTLSTGVASEHDDALTLVLEATPCDRDARSVEVVVTNPATGQREHRQVPVWDLDVAARPRAVALSSAELLVRIAWRDPTATAPSASSAPVASASASAAPSASATAPSAPDTPDDAPRDTSPARTAPREPNAPHPSAPDPARLLGVAFEYRIFPVLETALLGGRVGARFRVAHTPLELGVDLGAGTGTVSDALGTIRVTSGTAGFSLAHVSGARDLLVVVGPALELGYGSVSGEPAPGARGGSQGSPLAALLLDAGLRVRAGSDLWLGADALGGWSLSALRGLADDRPVAGTSGLVSALRVTVGQRW